MFSCGGNASTRPDGAIDGDTDPPLDAEPDSGPVSGQLVEIAALGISGPIEVMLDGAAGQTALVTEDGTFAFPARVEDGIHDVTITTPTCQLAAATVVIAAAKGTVGLVCDRVVELTAITLDVPYSPAIGFTPAYDPSSLRYTGSRGFLVEPNDLIDVTATLAYPTQSALEVSGIAASSGIATAVVLGTAVTITVSHPSGLSRTYSFGLAGQVPLAQEATHKSSAATAGDLFAQVAISHDTMVVGAPGDVPGGAAFVFQRIDRTWTEVARLTAPVPSAGDAFGSSVAIDGDTLAIGVPGDDGLFANSGAVHVYVRSGPGWELQAALKASPVVAEDRFGTAVAISGDTVIAGAPNEDTTQVDSGAAFVFARAATWSQQARLKAAVPRSADLFGKTVAIAGASVIVGAPMEDGSGIGVNPSPATCCKLSSGAAYVFTSDAGAWSQQAYLKATNSSDGDLFGSAVAISGNRVAIGAPEEDSNGSPADDSITNSGAAYAFDRAGTTWTFDAYLKASNIHGNARFGLAIALDRTRLLVGAPWENSSATGLDGVPDQLAAFSGAAYLFRRTGAWSQLRYVKPSNTAMLSHFGSSLTIEGDTFVVGAPKAPSTVDRQGAVYVFR
ncbi:MAG: hypothetical protein WKG01_08760 [Kofleriaceae bacterium]